MRTWICLALLLALTGLAFAQAKVFRPRTLLGGEYWGTQPEPGYLDYLAAVKPDLIHGAVVGPELLGSVYGKGALKGITPVYPPQVSTVKAYLAFWRGFNADAHKLGVKVQATTSMNLVWGDRAKNTGFFKYYHDLWETDLFGEAGAYPGSAAAGRCQRRGAVRTLRRVAAIPRVPEQSAVAPAAQAAGEALHRGRVRRLYGAVPLL